MDPPAERKETVKIAHLAALTRSSGSVPRSPRRLRAPATAPVVLPLAAGGLLAVGALVALTSGGVGPTALLVLACLIVATTAALSDPATIAMITLIAEFTAIAFTRRPYAQLRGGPLVWHAGVTLIAVAAISYGLAAHRPRCGPPAEHTDECEYAGNAGARSSNSGLPSVRSGAGRPRVARLPRCRCSRSALVNARHELSLADDLLLYLLVVVAVSVVGGFWPAVVTAAASGLLLNWYLTPPLHTLTIEEPQNLLALLLFVAVAISVSSIVHLAARRAGGADAQRVRRCRAARTGPHRARRGRHPGLGARSADDRSRRPRRIARKHRRKVG